ncbi:MAG: hypothetical protein NTY07_19170 [Bacteroidia bacterium]|nr:hypothetical protein [Bacteroidia bacterium]
MTLNEFNIKNILQAIGGWRLAAGNWLLATGFFLLVLSSCSEKVSPTDVLKEKPSLFPDYVGVTIPATIAPLNFKVKAEYTAIDAVIKGRNNQVIHLQDAKEICIPVSKWTKMLSGSKGDSLQITVSIKQHDKWKQYAPFAMYVSTTPIDYGLVYRLIAPGYEVYSKMGIYQRNLSNFDQSPIVENTLIPGSCVNCHSFRQSNTKDMSFHIRGKKGGTALISNGKMNLLNTKTDKTMSNFVYPFWHPSGNYIAYSVNNTHQVFHEAAGKRVEVGDAASDVVVYDIKNNQAISCNLLMQDSIFETFPSFSADGRTLYFCRAAHKKMPAEFNEVRYNLCSISFNPDNGTFGDRIDTLFNAVALQKSVTFPRPSPDGKYIMFTLIDYGNFSIWHKEADLYLLDLKTKSTRRIDEVNSDDTESYHSWSSNSRWFVFSSRRMDGLYTRPFIAYLDENGKAGKPFLLPQKDTEYYDRLLFSFNIPEFVNEKVDVNIPELEKLLESPLKKVTFKQ